MCGDQADMVLTDVLGNLPTDFAMAHGERSEGEFVAFFSSFLQLAKEASKPGAIMFVLVDWRRILDLLTAARAQQLPLKDMIVWATRNAGINGFYRPQHELIAALNGGAVHVNSGRQRSNLWEYPRGSSSQAGHTGELKRTSKPVALFADVILDVSRPGQIVFDPFAGTGSTLIAAEKTGRSAYVLESAPACCDLIIRRFETYTGNIVQLAGNGMTFAEAKKRRVAE